MMTSEEFYAFMNRHTERFPRSDWPKSDTEYWQEWAHMLISAGATLDHARRASREMIQCVPRYLEEHRKEHVRRCKEIRAAVELGIARSLDEALAHPDSKACGCDRGIAMAEYRGPARAAWNNGKPVMEAERRYRPVTCDCPAGRWQEYQQSQMPQETRLLTIAAARRIEGYVWAGEDEPAEIGMAEISDQMRKHMIRLWDLGTLPRPGAVDRTQSN